MLYIIPLLISLLIYILKEDKNIIIYGVISLIIINIIINMSINIINIEIILIIYLVLLILYWLLISIKDNTLIMLGGLFIIGSYLSIISTSIISLFISIELISFTIIIIINLYIQDQYPGIIYYLLSGLITSIFILSLGYLSLGYNNANYLLFIVFIFKLGLIPFHIILPLLYMNLSIKKIFIIDIPYKIIIFYIFGIKLNLILNNFIYYYILFLFLFSSIASIRYKNLINIMIYSSILNYSLILILIYLNYNEFFLFYIIYYSIFILIYLYLLTNYFINKQISFSYYLFLWILLFFNLIGIPPLSGFFIKYYVLSLIILNNLSYLIFFSFLSLLFISYTYLRILNTFLINTNGLNIYYVININKSYSNFISFLITFISFPLFY